MNRRLDDGRQRMVEMFGHLLGIGSPSGREARMSDWLCEYVAGMGYRAERDGAGNLLIRLPARDPAAPGSILAAHMDEIGIVVTTIEEDGTLHVDRSGGLAPHKLGERAVEIHGDGERVTGIVSFGSGHVEAGAVFSNSWKDVRLITGLSRRQLADKGIRPGAVAVPVAAGRGPFLLGEGDAPLIAAWTLDDRAGMVVLLELLRRLKEHALVPHRPMIIAFTVSEEVGGHGAKFLAARERPEFFIGVDGCPWSPGCGFDVNDRPTVWSKDMLAHYDQDLIGTLTRAASAAGTDCQMAVLTGAYSDASAVYDNGTAPRAGLIGHARYNSHGFEVACLDSFGNIVATLVELVKMEIW